jgi:hypothetical protein
MNGNSDQDAKRTQLLGSKQQKYSMWIAAQRLLFGELERTDAKEGYGHIFLAIDGPMH